MGLTDLTVRLLLIFLPGIICFLVVDALTVHKERKTHDILIFSYIFGFLSYFTYGIILLLVSARLLSRRPWLRFKAPDELEMSFLKGLTDSKVGLDFLEIIWVTLISLVLALILSWCDKRKVLHVIAQKTRTSNKFGEPDVWNFALNMNDARWCLVRDFSNKLMIQGYIRAFSDVGETAELLLTNVCVYNEESGLLLYESERLYLSRKKDELTVEFQQLPKTGD